MQVPYLPKDGGWDDCQAPEKFGGDMHYDSYEALEADFVSGAMHPMDLKKGLRRDA